MKYEPWQIWGRKPVVEATLEARARGDLPEMECTKQLVRLVSNVYQPGMRILDVGCNCGHYLRSLRRLDPNICYVGIDAYPYYIEKAKAIFTEDERTAFLVRDIMEPLFPYSPFDIVFCCNVILHLPPDFKIPIRHLVESTKGVCFIRTLLGENTTIVKRIHSHDFDAQGNPLDFTYQNTYETDWVVDYVKSLGCSCEVIDDEFKPEVLANEFTQFKKGFGTRVVGGKQADSNIIFEWKWLRITR